MHNPPDPTMQPRGFSPDLRVMVGGAQRERKSSIKSSLFGKKMYESLKKKLQLNSFFWYNHSQWKFWGAAQGREFLAYKNMEKPARYSFLAETMNKIFSGIV